MTTALSHALRTIYPAPYEELDDAAAADAEQETAQEEES